MTILNSGKNTPWQTALIQAITDPAELLDLLELDPNLLDAARAAAKLFPLQVPRGFVDRMQKGNLEDPLLQQILPLGAELTISEGYSEDPLGEAKVNPIPGLLHKYQGRVLLTPVGTCGVNCRFCFRRHFPYGKNNPGSDGWELALNYIAQNPAIDEVILSGGDPLIASDKTLHNLTEKLAQIPHVKRLRIHSRIPVVMPERITSEFIDWISSIKQKPVLIIHCNHPQEINQAVIDAMLALKKAGVVLLNQSVLLKGINDSAAILAVLCERLFEIGVMPYYIHLLDKVQGAAHFDMPVETAQQLHWELSQLLSGYLVPKLVYEKAGAPAKITLGI